MVSRSRPPWKESDGTVAVGVVLHMIMVEAFVGTDVGRIILTNFECCLLPILSAAPFSTIARALLVVVEPWPVATWSTLELSIVAGVTNDATQTCGTCERP